MEKEKRKFYDVLLVEASDELSRCYIRVDARIFNVKFPYSVPKYISLLMLLKMRMNVLRMANVSLSLLNDSMGYSHGYNSKSSPIVEIRNMLRKLESDGRISVFHSITGEPLDLRSVRTDVYFTIFVNDTEFLSTNTSPFVTLNALEFLKIYEIESGGKKSIPTLIAVYLYIKYASSSPDGDGVCFRRISTISAAIGVGHAGVASALNLLASNHLIYSQSNVCRLTTSGTFTQIPNMYSISNRIFETGKWIDVTKSFYDTSELMYNGVIY